MSVFDELDTKTIDRLKRRAQEAQATPLPFLNYEGGVWKIGGEQVTDSEWVVATDMCAVGWTLFHDNQIGGELYVSALGNEKPPRPKTHTDKSLLRTMLTSCAAGSGRPACTTALSASTSRAGCFWRRRARPAGRS